MDSAAEREQMVRSQLMARGIRNPRVLEALAEVPREQFVPEDQRDQAYLDCPLPIGEGQTISQPYIVALMSELCELEPGERVLEIGTGSGYQAAVLAALGAEVFSIEISPILSQRAADALAACGFSAHLRQGDGYQGWPDQAPFDAIILTAAPPRIPAPLLEQLAVGGRLVAPVGQTVQELIVVARHPHGFEQNALIPVRFVPMTGKAQNPE